MNFSRTEAVLITNPLNVLYLTNFTGSNGQVLIIRNGEKYFLTDSRYDEQVRKEINKKYKIKIYKKIEDSLKEIISEHNIKKLGFESKHLTYYQYFFYSRKLGIELSPLDSPVEKQRIIKKKREISKIKKAVEIAEQSIQETVKYLFQPHIKEIDFKRILENKMLEYGAEAPSFPTIVASGKRSSLVHGMASRKSIKKDSTVIIDFGAKFKGYCSDKTITFLNKKSCKEIKDVYNIVKDAKNFAIEKIKPGIKASDVDKTARDFIRKKGYEQYFKHSLGHGVGLNVHEEPVLSPFSEDIIKSGMVFTIEPGIYIKEKFGVRLEDMILATDSGAELLTTPAENFIFKEFV